VSRQPAIDEERQTDDRVGIRRSKENREAGDVVRLAEWTARMDHKHEVRAAIGDIGHGGVHLHAAPVSLRPPVGYEGTGRSLRLNHSPVERQGRSTRLRGGDVEWAGTAVCAWLVIVVDGRDALRADAEPCEVPCKVAVGSVVPQRIVVDVAGEVGRDDDGADLHDRTRFGSVATDRDAAAVRGAHDEWRDGLALAD